MRRLMAKTAHQHPCVHRHADRPYCFCIDREARECSRCRHVTFQRYVDSLSAEALLERRA